MNNQTKQDKGFTLVELLIVIVILGILATVTVFAVRGITQDAEQNACDTEQDVIETAIEAFNADSRRDALFVDELTGTSGYLKDDLAFAAAFNLLVPVNFDGTTPVAPALPDTNVNGRWNITFGGAAGPVITGVGDCTPAP